MNLAGDSPETLRGVRQDLAAWITPTMPEAAMHLRSIADDTVGALTLMASHGAIWLARGLHRTVHGWLRDLPQPVSASDRAAVAFWRAQALLPLEPEAARPLFATARRIAVEANDADRAYTAWCGEVESFVIQWGAVHGLADLVDDLESLPAKVGPSSEHLSFRTGAAALTALMYGRATIDASHALPKQRPAR